VPTAKVAAVASAKIVFFIGCSLQGQVGRADHES
jgi:hypothetical protein